MMVSGEWPLVGGGRRAEQQIALDGKTAENAVQTEIQNTIQNEIQNTIQNEIQNTVFIVFLIRKCDTKYDPKYNAKSRYNTLGPRHQDFSSLDRTILGVGRIEVQLVQGFVLFQFARLYE